jgi:flavodoxin
MQKKLVAYFSASGVTAKAAQALAQAAGADLYEIKPQVPYTSADLNWMDEKARSTVEMKDPASRPAIADGNAHLAAYDVVFVCFPIWWYVAPRIIQTFLESADFSGKTVVVCATSGGSGFGRTVDVLKDSVSPKTVLKEGKLLNGRLSQQELSAWVESLGL